VIREQDVKTCDQPVNARQSENSLTKILHFYPRFFQYINRFLSPKEVIIQIEKQRLWKTL